MVIIVCLLCVAAFVARWALLAGCSPIISPDSVGYENAMKKGILQNPFFKGRPRGYPLVMEALGESRTRVVLFQRLLSGISWISISIACAYRLRTKALKWIAAIAIFMFGCTPLITCWDAMIMTESMTISLFLIIVTIVLCWDDVQKSLVGVTALVLVLFYFSILRDANAYLLPIVALYVLLVEFFAWRKGGTSHEWKTNPWRVAIRLLLISLIPAALLFLNYEAKISKRWEAALSNSLNLLVFRGTIPYEKIWIIDSRNLQEFVGTGQDKDIPQDEGNLMYLVNHYGMPLDEAKLHIGHVAWDQIEKPTPAYDAWIVNKGYDAYSAFLLSHPKWVLSNYARCGNLYSFDSRLIMQHWKNWKSDFKDTGNETLMIVERFYFNTFGLLAHLRFSYLIMIPISLALFIWWIMLQRAENSSIAFRSLVATIAVLFCFAYVIGFIAWFGDGYYQSMWRHAIVGMVAYYIAIIMLTLAIADILVRRQSKEGIPHAAGCPVNP
ncbi:MAG: hypothetical protein NTZ78_07395 [Candidatus Aureabacteria bacterium]|nr:hypothetical protein [Candidatus Auribacterota bacterium]